MSCGACGAQLRPRAMWRRSGGLTLIAAPPTRWTPLPDDRQINDSRLHQHSNRMRYFRVAAAMAARGTAGQAAGSALGRCGSDPDSEKPDCDSDSEYDPEPLSLSLALFLDHDSLLCSPYTELFTRTRGNDSLQNTGRTQTGWSAYL